MENVGSWENQVRVKEGSSLLESESENEIGDGRGRLGSRLCEKHTSLASYRRIVLLAYKGSISEIEGKRDEGN